MQQFLCLRSDCYKSARRTDCTSEYTSVILCADLYIRTYVASVYYSLCTHTHMYTYTHTCTPTHTHVHLHTHMYTYTHTHTPTHPPTPTPTHPHPHPPIPTHTHAPTPTPTPSLARARNYAHDRECVCMRADQSRLGQIRTMAKSTALPAKKLKEVLHYPA